MTAIVIDSITIRQDSEGRFCLNDLHKAAGGKRRHEPNLWLTNQTTRELIQELTTPNTGIPVFESLRGRYGGTYVCKELVYAYAMWISPQFHLKVIRAYDRLATRGVAVHESAAEDLLKNPLKYMREVLDQAEKIKAERDGLVETVGQCQHTLGRFARTLPGVNLNKIKESLLKLGYLYRPQGTGSYRVYSKHRHLFQEKHLDQYGTIELFPTPEGRAVLAGLYKEGKLLMKKGFSQNF